MKWKVYRNGKDTGIVETKFVPMSRYWEKRAVAEGSIIQLIKQEETL